MNPNEYQELALRTVKPTLMFWKMDPMVDSELMYHAQQQLAANAALGLCGENVEIQADPTTDECGDGLWYAAVMCKVLNIDMTALFERHGKLMYPTYVATSPGEAERYMTKGAGIVAEKVKKFVFHSKGLPFNDILHGLRLYVAGLKFIAPESLDVVMQFNIDKLKDRWPEGFTA